ncbi:HSP70-domain-containing protein [Periconia macrospinosa]|uniref:HSP70-domain-containing protein n=1 Tax=Periconia macrospinosa TaxID=97972 RepID=A0A2V1E347_9PLEO|nr:HSP70-domain-containing protein [Periconia macrospinosa]
MHPQILHLTSRHCRINTTSHFAEVIEDSQGFTTIPNYVSFTDSGVLVGHAAKARWLKDANTVFFDRELLGKNFSAIQNTTRALPYKLIDRGGSPKIEIEYSAGVEEYSPKDIFVHILSYLKDMAEQSIGRPVEFAVATLPGICQDGILHCNYATYHSVKTDLEDAGVEADLSILRATGLSSSIANAYLNGSMYHWEPEQYLLVYNADEHGYGAAVFQFDEVYFDPLSTASFAESLSTVTFLKSSEANSISYRLSCMAKILPTIWQGFVTKMKARSFRSQYDYPFPYSTIVNPLPKEASSIIGEAIEKARISEKYHKDLKIAHVLFIGDLDRYPAVRSMLGQHFLPEQLRYLDVRISAGFNPEQARVMGAAMVGYSFMGHDLFPHITYEPPLPPWSFFPVGIEIHGGIYKRLIDVSQGLPTQEKIRLMVPAGRETVTLNLYEGTGPFLGWCLWLGTLNLTLSSLGRNASSSIEVILDEREDHSLLLTARDENSESRAFLEISAYKRESAEIEHEEANPDTSIDYGSYTEVKKIEVLEMQVVDVEMNRLLRILTEMRRGEPVEGNGLTIIRNDTWWNKFREGQIDGYDPKWLDVLIEDVKDYMWRSRKKQEILEGYLMEEYHEAQWELEKLDKQMWVRGKWIRSIGAGEAV